MTATSFYHEHGDPGAEVVREFPERLNLGYIVSHGGTDFADGANGRRMAA
jgi:hypothetical protein